ncbi:MAG: S8 family serine peptidase [Microcoleus sp.]
MATTNEVSSNLLIDVLITDTLPGSAAKNSILNPLSSSNSQNIGGSPLIADTKTQPIIEPEKLSSATDTLNSKNAIAEPNSKKIDDSLIVSDTLKGGLSGSASTSISQDTISSSPGTDVKDTLTGSTKDAQLVVIKGDSITATDSLTNPQSVEKIPSEKSPDTLAEKETKPEIAIAQNTSVAESKPTTTTLAETQTKTEIAIAPNTSVTESKPATTTLAEKETKTEIAIAPNTSVAESKPATTTLAEKETKTEMAIAQNTSVVSESKATTTPDTLATKESKPEMAIAQNTSVAESKETTTPDTLVAKESKPEMAIAQNTSVVSEPKETAISEAIKPDNSTAEKPATTVADVSKDSNPEKSPASSTENNKQSTDNTEVVAVETQKELSPTVPKSEPVADNSFTSGKFVVDSTGQVGIDFLFDGGLYKGQLAIISLKGMEKFSPGSEEFLKEVASRALSNSAKGHVVIDDLSEGAKFTGNLPEGNSNDGSYLGVKTFAMTPGEEFGVMLVPNGTVQEVLNNPAIGGDKRPLFSMVTANPAEGFYLGQIADVTGSGKTFTMEDMRVDLGSDRDYNDFVFQVRGATGQAVNLDSVINADKDWRKTDMGQALIAYAKPYVEPKLEPVKEDAKPVTNSESNSVLDVPISDTLPTAKEDAKPVTNSVETKDVAVSETKVTPTDEAKTEPIAPVSTATESVSKTEVATSDTTVTPAVKIEEDKKAIVPVSTATESVSKTEVATSAGLTHGESETGFFSENTSLQPTDAVKNPVSLVEDHQPSSDKTVTPAVKIEEDKKAIVPVSTANESVAKTEVATSDTTVTPAVKIEEDKKAIVPVSTATESVSKTEVATSTELTHGSPETGFFDENTSLQPTDSVKNPVSLVEADQPSSDKTVTPAVIIEEEKKAIVPVFTPNESVSKTEVATSDKTVVSEVKIAEEKKAIVPVSTATEPVAKTEVATSDTTVTPAVKIEEEKKAIVPVSTATESVAKTEVTTSDKTVTPAVIIEEEKKAIVPISTNTESVSKTEIATSAGLTHGESETGFFSENTSLQPTDSLKNPVSLVEEHQPSSDTTVTPVVKIEEEKKAIVPISTNTESVSKTEIATSAGLTHGSPETGFFDENTSLQPTDSVKNPVSLVEADQPSSDTTVTPVVETEEEKKAIVPVSTSTKDAPASEKTVTTLVETETQTQTQPAPQPAPKNLSTVEIETKTNQPQPAVTLSPKNDDKPAISTQEVAKVSQPIAQESKPAIYPQELSAVNQSIATDSKPVTATPEVAKPAIATNSQPAISLQEVAPVTQPVAPNAISTIATNSQQKTSTDPINPVQNVGSNPAAMATSFHFLKASQPLVGIIGTGFNVNNFDIDYSRITLGKDRIANDDNPLIKSGEGSEQGTHVLGLIAATQNNSKGIDGINNEAPIWLGRASGNNSWAESLIEFVDTAKKSAQSNAVVNISFELTQVDASGKIVPRYELTEAENNALEYARKNHIVVVVPAGNNPQEISALGKASLQFDNIITVGASSGGQVTDYSGTGKGLDILTEGGTLNNPVRSTVGESTGLMAGTSVAAAQVTGAISQVWAANPLLNYQQVIDIIKRTATDIALPNWDAKTGAGLLNLAAAVPLAKATEAKPLPPEATVQDVVSQINNLAPELDQLLEQFKAESDKISANPDSALVEPKPEDEKQASQELDALIADLQKDIDDLQNDPFADVDGIASEYQFDAKDQPLIGIIDTGFAENNPDIDYSRIIKGSDYNDSDDNPLLPTNDPKAEHGTKVLEIIGAKQNNDIGINGVNDDAPLWVGRAVGSGKWAQSLREFVDAVKVSKQPNAIVNLSFDLIDKDGNTRTKFTAEERAAIEYARDNKVLIVAAAGNQGVEGLSALGKASRDFPNIITVGAADWNGNLADYSSYGAGIDLVAFGSTPESQASSNTTSNEDLLKDLTPLERQAVEKAIKFNEAPTEDAKLTEAEEQLVLEATKKLGKALGDIKNPDSNWAASIPEIVGTSIAAAKVTGAASQVWAANPNLSLAQVKAILKATAVDLGTPGWDIQTGAGLLNLADAVAMAKSPPTGLDVADSILSSNSDVWSGEGASEQEARGFFKKLWNGAKKVFNKVSGFVGKVVGFVNKVSSFIGKVKDFFSKVSGIFSTVKKVFSWISTKFLALPILGKVGIVLGGIALVGGAIAGLVAWFKKKQQPPAQPPVQNTTPQEIIDLQGIWGGLPTVLKTALKNGINSPYGRPLFQGDPAGILPLIQTLSSINPGLNSTSPQLYSWLLYGTPAQFLPVLQGSAPTPALPADVANAWSVLNPQQKQELLKFLQGGIPQLYQPLFNGTDPDGILPLLNGLGGISPNAQSTVLTFLPGGIPSPYQPNFP